LAITTCSGLVALAVHASSGSDFLVTFVVLRWVAVAVLLVTPLIRYVRPDVVLSGPLRTPLTALFLTTESILVDIVSAQLH
jgi:hypothetical protein